MRQKLSSDGLIYNFKDYSHCTTNYSTSFLRITGAKYVPLNLTKKKKTKTPLSSFIRMHETKLGNHVEIVG